MNIRILAGAGVLSVLLLAGCNRAEPTSEVSKDVANAQADASKELADAKRDQAETAVKGEHEVNDAARDANEAQQKADYEVAVTRADGVEKVALQKCEAMSGADQSTCKERARAEKDLAVANAKTAYPAAVR